MAPAQPMVGVFVVGHVHGKPHLLLSRRSYTDAGGEPLAFGGVLRIAPWGKLEPYDSTPLYCALRLAQDLGREFLKVFALQEKRPEKLPACPTKPHLHLFLFETDIAPLMPCLTKPPEVQELLLCPLPAEDLEPADPSQDRQRAIHAYRIVPNHFAVLKLHIEGRYGL